MLAHLITTYEEETSELPEVDPVELIKIRMEDFGYRPVDLAREYGDKGTISAVGGMLYAVGVGQAAFLETLGLTGFVT